MKLKIYSGKQIKMNIKEQVWIPVILLIGFFLAFPVAELLMMGNWFGMNYTYDQIQILYENLWKDGFLRTGSAITVIAALLNSVSEFWYLYSSKKVDFYHSIPVKRSRMFFSRMFTGIIFFAGPYLLMEFLTVCIGAMRGCFSLHLMKLAFYMFLIHLICYLLIYFAIVLVICITGNFLMGGLCFVGVFLYGTVLSSLITGYEETYFRTYARMLYGVCKVLKRDVSPLFLGNELVDKYSQGELKGFLFPVLCVVLVLTAASFFAYIKRPSERTGEALIYPFTQVVIRILVVIPTGLGTGLFFSLFPENTSSRDAWEIFGLLVGVILSYSLLEIVYQMDFRKIYVHWVQLILCGVLAILMAAGFKTDVIRYDRYFPKSGQVEMISWNGVNMESSDYAEEKADGRYVIGTNSVEAMIDLGNSEDLLQAVKKAADRTYKNIKNNVGKEDLEESGRMVTFGFTMNFGTTIYRNYIVDSQILKDILQAAYREGDYKKDRYSILNIESKYLFSITGIFGDGVYTTLWERDKEKRTEFLEALRQDILEADAEVLTGQPCGKLYLSFGQIPQERTPDNMVPDGRECLSGAGGMVYIFPQFSRSLALLEEEEDLSISLQDVDVESADVVFDLSEDATVLSDPVQYTGKEELTELKNILIPPELVPEWETFNSPWADLTLNIRGKEAVEGWAIRPGEKTPEFILLDQERAQEGILGENESEDSTDLTTNLEDTTDTEVMDIYE